MRDLKQREFHFVHSGEKIKPEYLYCVYLQRFHTENNVSLGGQTFHKPNFVFHLLLFLPEERKSFTDT